MSSIASLRKNVGLVVLFAFLAITFLLLAAGTFTGSVGYVLILTLKWTARFWLYLAVLLRLVVSWVPSLHSSPTTMAWQDFLPRTASPCLWETSQSATRSFHNVVGRWFSFDLSEIRSTEYKTFIPFLSPYIIWIGINFTFDVAL